MLAITATADWHSAHPGGAVGLLEMSGALNSAPASALDPLKRATEERLRSRYAGYTRKDLLEQPVLAAYQSYYRRFNKTYHVQLQLESILKGKSLPSVSPLVDANFVSELDSLILTAGHDLERLLPPVAIDVSREGDSMTLMNGTAREIYPGDMVMRDAEGIACSIIYGQDNRSPITPQTTHVLYVSYAPPGVSADLVGAHLQRIADTVRTFSPGAALEQLRVIVAGEEVANSQEGHR
ncbi:MAG: phenylalanine--tRNA ligase beta subunit-related protein [Anaerolineae bacterium]